MEQRVSTLLATWDGLSAYKATPFPPDYPSNTKHLFAPVDQVHEAFVALCSPSDLSSLDASMYGWDDSTIDELFRRALLQERLPVTLCLDSSQAAGVHEREIVAKWPGGELGNDVVIGRSAKGAINHDKLIVVNRLLTICGSTNLSEGGESRQNNEATIVYDRAFAGEVVNRIQIIKAQMRQQMEAREHVGGAS
jgi:phosphatidylserine/phosphatidylglycerophosphate/cardiolipin synthase-like enzyme